LIELFNIMHAREAVSALVQVLIIYYADFNVAGVGSLGCSTISAIGAG
jgi:hypothetical protein